MRPTTYDGEPFEYSKNMFGDSDGVAPHVGGHGGGHGAGMTGTWQGHGRGMAGSWPEHGGDM